MSFIMGDSTMLTQYDAVILAGLPTREVAGEPRKRFDAVKYASAEDQAAEKAERPSRLDILLEPVAQVVVSVRAFLGEGRRRERQIYPEASPNRTT